MDSRWRIEHLVHERRQSLYGLRRSYAGRHLLPRSARRRLEHQQSGEPAFRGAHVGFAHRAHGQLRVPLRARQDAVSVPSLTPVPQCATTPGSPRGTQRLNFPREPQGSNRRLSKRYPGSFALSTTVNEKSACDDSMAFLTDWGMGSEMLEKLPSGLPVSSTLPKGTLLTLADGQLAKTRIWPNQKRLLGCAGSATSSEIREAAPWKTEVLKLIDRTGRQPEPPTLMEKRPSVRGRPTRESGTCADHWARLSNPKIDCPSTGGGPGETAQPRPQSATSIR